MPSLRVLLSADQIQARVVEMAAAIDRDYSGGPLYLIGVLNHPFAGSLRVTAENLQAQLAAWEQVHGVPDRPEAAPTSVQGADGR